VSKLAPARIAISVIALATYSCGTDQRLGDVLELTFISTADVQSNITALSVDGKLHYLPQSPAVSRCTADRERFLNQESVTIEVTTADGRTTTTELERVACRFAKKPGHREITQVRLNRDGTIDADFEAGDPMVYTTCDETAMRERCEEDEL
jgi:hypothetical protein